MSSQDIKSQVLANLCGLSTSTRAKITSIDVHPRTFVGLCMAARANSPVAPAPTELYGIKININADLKEPYSFVFGLKNDNTSIKTAGYRPTMIICDDIIPE